MNQSKQDGGLRVSRTIWIIVAFSLMTMIAHSTLAGVVVPIGVNSSSYFGTSDTWSPWGPVINQPAGLNPVTGISCCNNTTAAAFNAFTGLTHGGDGSLSNGLMGFDLTGDQAAGLSGNPSDVPSIPATAPANSAGMANYPLLSNYAKGLDTDDKPRSSWFTDGGETSDQWIEIELPALTPLEQIWIWNWNDGPENRMAGSLDIQYSATDIGGLVTHDEGTPADPNQMNWVTALDDGTPRSTTSRQIGRIPDWEQAFAGATARYIRISDIDHILDDPSGGNNYVGLSGVLIFDQSGGPPQLATAWEYTANGDNIGDWASDNNWSAQGGLVVNPRANNPNHTAIFGDAITVPTTIVTNAAVSINNIQFTNTSNSYLVAGHGNVNLYATTDPESPVNPSISVQGSHTFQTPVNFHASSNVSVDSGATLTFDGAVNLSGTTLTKTGDGALHLNNDVTLGGGSVVGAGGVIGGSGTIGGNVENSATVAPGNSPGILTISGNYTQSSSGTLAIEVTGTGAGENGHDQLVVTGAATLDGTLDIQTDAGFTPSVGASPGVNGDGFFILTAGTVTGQFSNVNGRHVGNGLFYEIDAQATHVKLAAFQALEGDANGDKKIDITDFNVLSSNFDPTAANANDWTNADFNADGNVDITDFNFLSSNFAPSGYGDGPGQIPEPNTMLLLGLGLLAVAGWRHTRP
ncbi:MAG: PEP-CTERM sorting domain-containing protein [Pirellulaceae bacterium]|nr:PEP-CTERM sorting domain-containing protein [Pirellulaceae bacterium]